VGIHFSGELCVISVLRHHSHQRSTFFQQTVAVEEESLQHAVGAACRYRHTPTGDATYRFVCFCSRGIVYSNSPRPIAIGLAVDPSVSKTGLRIITSIPTSAAQCTKLCQCHFRCGQEEPVFGGSIILDGRRRRCGDCSRIGRFQIQSSHQRLVDREYVCGTELSRTGDCPSASMRRGTTGTFFLPARCGSDTTASLHVQCAGDGLVSIVGISDEWYPRIR
jgi:hypothetical protein